VIRSAFGDSISLDAESTSIYPIATLDVALFDSRIAVSARRRISPNAIRFKEERVDRGAFSRQKRDQPPKETRGAKYIPADAALFRPPGSAPRFAARNNKMMLAVATRSRLLLRNGLPIVREALLAARESIASRGSRAREIGVTGVKGDARSGGWDTR